MKKLFTLIAAALMAVGVNAHPRAIVTHLPRTTDCKLSHRDSHPRQIYNMKTYSPCFRQNMNPTSSVWNYNLSRNPEPQQ